MKKWTKKDINILCQTISSFWLYNRPLNNSISQHNETLSKVQAYLDREDLRLKVVYSGLTQLRDLNTDRAQEAIKASDHYHDHPDVMGKSTPEMVQQISKLAMEYQKDADKAVALIRRLELEGLPPEVINFDPSALR